MFRKLGGRDQAVFCRRRVRQAVLVCPGTAGSGFNSMVLRMTDDRTDGGSVLMGLWA